MTRKCLENFTFLTNNILNILTEDKFSFEKEIL